MAHGAHSESWINCPEAELPTQEELGGQPEEHESAATESGPNVDVEIVYGDSLVVLEVEVVDGIGAEIGGVGGVGGGATGIPTISVLSARIIVKSSSISSVFIGTMSSTPSIEVDSVDTGTTGRSSLSSSFVTIDKPNSDNDNSSPSPSPFSLLLSTSLFING